MEIFDFKQGRAPLLISIPHAGENILPNMGDRLTPAGQSLIDTDWHVPQLYPFADELGASVLKANYSRYVTDLNRDKNDTDLYPGQVKTGLCPLETFNGDTIYLQGKEPDAAEIQKRIATYWQPYHDKLRAALDSIKRQHGYALLFDAHSIKSELPRLFEGRLPDLNLGTNFGKTCGFDIETQLAACASNGPYNSVINGRFVGGYITRHYGAPLDDIHAVQMELIWDLYMDEQTLSFDSGKASRLSSHLHEILACFIEAAGRRYK